MGWGIFGLWLWLGLAGAAVAQGVAGATTFEDCQTQGGESMRQEIRATTRRTLERALLQVDYQQLVDERWQALGLGVTLDDLVAQAIAAAKDDKGYFARLSSMYSKDQAQDLASYVSQRVYGSTVFQRRFDLLANDLANALAQRLGEAATTAQAVAVSCLQAFISTGYGEAVRDAFKVGIDPLVAGPALDRMAEVPGLDVMDFKGTIAGVTLLVLRQSAQRLTARITQRLAGRIAARLAGKVAVRFVPWVGWGLVGYDLWTGRNGILPELERELTSEAAKAQMRAAIAADLRQALPTQTDGVAQVVADGVHARWVAFKRQFRRVLALAQDHPTFGRYLDSLAPGEFARLAALVDILLQLGGEDQVLAALERGELERAMGLPGEALGIIEDLGSIAPALAWWELVGVRIVAVYRHGLHRRLDPEAWESGQLDVLLSVGQPRAIATLAGLEVEALTPLLTLPVAHLRHLATRLNPAALGAVAWYLERLDPTGRESMFQQLLTDSHIPRFLGSLAVRRAVVESRDPRAALAFMGKPVLLTDPWTLYGDIQVLASGAISPSLAWHKYGLALGWLAAVALLPLLLPLLLLRWLLGGRTKVVVAKVASR